MAWFVSPYTEYTQNNTIWKLHLLNTSEDVDNMELSIAMAMNFLSSITPQVNLVSGNEHRQMLFQTRR